MTIQHDGHVMYLLRVLYRFNRPYGQVPEKFGTRAMAADHRHAGGRAGAEDGDFERLRHGLEGTRWEGWRKSEMVNRKAGRLESEMRYNVGMKRWLARILTAVSLLLCIAAAGMWVRSYWVVESWIGHLEAGHFEVVSMKGLAGFHWEPDFNYGNYYGYHSARLPGEGFSLRNEGQSEYGTLDDNAVWAVLGFSFSRRTSGNPAVCWRVSAHIGCF